jgi:hypothetical protein
MDFPEIIKTSQESTAMGKTLVQLENKWGC